MHFIFPFVLAMIAAIVLLERLATRLKIAYPILLVVAGLLISVIPGLPVLRIHPDFIFLIFLPPLLSDASWRISFKEMKKWWRIISSFAFLVVFFTACSVAIVANYYIPGFSIALGFLLGGIVAPPDAVSTGAITRFVKIPRATSTILEGESLLNDASALIIFQFALVAIGTGQFIWQTAAASFLWIVAGGIAVGLLLAWIFVQLHKRLSFDASSDIAFTIIEPYFMYWLAEELGCSGVLAVVSGGLYMSAKRHVFLKSTSRIQRLHVWDSLIFVLNGTVFLIIGLELPEIVDGIRANGIPLRTAIGYGILITIVLVAARIISSYIAMLATFIFRPGVAPQSDNRLFIPLVLGWSGMRGVVSLAAALAIPIRFENGMTIPHRDLILFITFVVILLTLVVQGLTLPYIIRRSRVFDLILNGESPELTRGKIKEELKEHVQQFLTSRAEVHAKVPGIERYLRLWEDKAQASNDRMSDDVKAVYAEILETQRQYLNKLNKDPRIDEEIIRTHLYQIDLEEERLRII
jgi:CPA1 family monovalent cation:H+ antiporter